EFLPYRGDQRGIGRELQGQSFVFVETASDEFGQADGADQARSHAADELSPMHVSTGSPTQSASLAAVCALTGRLSRKRSAKRWRGRCLDISVFGANTRREGSTPRALASLRRLRVAASLVPSNHNTLPST